MVDEKNWALKKKPVRFRVQTEERMREVASLCDKNGWKFIGEFDPDQPEEIREVEYMLNPQSVTSQPRMGKSDNMTLPYKKPKNGRNSPCPCGSGKKYKKCCLELKDKSDLIDRLNELKIEKNKNS